MRACCSSTGLGRAWPLSGLLKYLKEVPECSYFLVAFSSKGTTSIMSYREWLSLSAVQAQDRSNKEALAVRLSPNVRFSQDLAQ